MVELRTARCIVRSYEPGDAESLAANGNNRKIWLNLRDRFPHPFHASDATGYITAMRAQEPQTSFAIDVDGAAVGGISLHRGTDIERISAELGYWIGEAYWGRGIVSDAVQAVTDWGLRELGLLRIFAVPYLHNVASQRVLEKAGFEREGILRSSALKDGQVLDQCLYARVSPNR